MSEQFENNLRGVLFNNDKRKSDASPDMTGHLEIEGTEYWVSAWWQEAKTGVEYLSFRINPKEDEEPAPASKRSASQPARAPARSPSRSR